PGGVAVMVVGQEVGLDPPIVGLTVLPLMRRGAVDARVRPVHRPVAEAAVLRLNLQRPGQTATEAVHASPRRDSGVCAAAPITPLRLWPPRSKRRKIYG